jgi:hypothetical protein
LIICGGNVILGIMRQTKITHLDFNEDIVDIHLNIHKKLDLNKKFQFAIKKIRERFKIKGFGELTRKALDQLFKNPKLIKQSEKLTTGMGLPDTWQPIVHEYVIWGGYYGPVFDPDAFVLETRTKNKKTEKEYYLRIFPHTSIRDIKRAWNKIQKIINPNGIQKRKKTNKKAYRNLEMYYMEKNGKTISEIFNLINKKYPQKDKNKNDIDPELIKTTISKLKKLEDR